MCEKESERLRECERERGEGGAQQELKQPHFQVINIGFQRNSNTPGIKEGGGDKEDGRLSPCAIFWVQLTSQNGRGG